MIPFEPESIDDMRKRFSCVRATVFCIEQIRNGTCKRPGQLKDFVFDFDDGMRLIVNREAREKQIDLHVSVSFLPESRLTYVSIPALRDDIICRMKTLYDADYVVKDTFIADGGVLHITCEDWEEK